MRSARATSVRAKRLRAAQARRNAQVRLHLENEVKGMQLELNAVVEYLRAHESRITGCERQLRSRAGEWEWLRTAAQKVRHTWFWKAIGSMRQFTSNVV